MRFDLLQRKRTHFVLWRPAVTNPPPALVIGTFRAGNPPSFERLNRFDLAPSPMSADLWELAAAACSLVDGHVYHYWLEVTNANPSCRRLRAFCAQIRPPGRWIGACARRCCRRLSAKTIAARRP
jgi:hypothetical protein